MILQDASGSVKLWEITKGVVIEDYQSCGRQLVAFSCCNLNDNLVF